MSARPPGSLKTNFPKKPSAAVTSILKSHRILSVAVIPGFPLLCAGLWLFANRKEALEKIVETGLVFGH
ncbi:MAG: hypothetical protein AUG13_07875 [Chloroflexi bacterium 13_1_20CM_2_59_7]|nr:MAG: hypothetical protein AUG13_07875 [Chloroflexi bacterium 13_1_20CM_2_59_7]